MNAGRSGAVDTAVDTAVLSLSRTLRRFPLGGGEDLRTLARVVTQGRCGGRLDQLRELTGPVIHPSADALTRIPVEPLRPLRTHRLPVNLLSHGVVLSEIA